MHYTGARPDCKLNIIVTKMQTFWFNIFFCCVSVVGIFYTAGTVVSELLRKHHEIRVHTALYSGQLPHLIQYFSPPRAEYCTPSDTIAVYDIILSFIILLLLREYQRCIFPTSTKKLSKGVSPPIVLQQPIFNSLDHIYSGCFRYRQKR